MRPEGKGQFERRFGIKIDKYMALSPSEQAEVRQRAAIFPDVCSWIEAAYASGDQSAVAAAKEGIDRYVDRLNRTDKGEA